MRRPGELGVTGTLALAGLAGFAVLATGAALGLYAQNFEQAVAREHMPPGPGAWLGTDALGRDLLARTIQGARVSLAVGVGAALGMVSVGTLLGALAGMRRGWTDRALSSLTDAVAAIPPVVLLLAAALILTPGMLTAIVAISLTQWTGVFRSVRAEALRMRSADHDRAAVAMAASTGHRVRWHLIPRLRPLLVTSLVLCFVYAVKVEAVLAYFGASARLPSWGRLLAESGSELARGIWWPIAAASVPLALLVLCAQLLADRLTDDEPGG
ncbi:MAG TPA: ABC transporter permease [Nannocystis sp.]|jgi:peptide/nickel transport system permease protein